MLTMKSASLESVAGFTQTEIVSAEEIFGVALLADAAVQTDLSDLFGAPAPPAAPASLSATAGDGQVALSWPASAGATSYNVKRSLTTGGTYTTVATVARTVPVGKMTTAKRPPVSRSFDARFSSFQDWRIWVKNNPSATKV